MTMQDDAKLAAARRHMEALKGFYIHLAIFCIVMLGLVAINAATSSVWWVQWPLLGWGIGVFAHWFAVFSPFKPFSRNWEQKRIDDYMRR